MGIDAMRRKVDSKKAREKTAPRPKAQDKPPVGASAIQDEEFAEFCEADKLVVEADPEFKETLRKRLWKLLKELHGMWALLLGGFGTFR